MVLTSERIVLKFFLITADIVCMSYLLKNQHFGSQFGNKFLRLKTFAVCLFAVHAVCVGILSVVAE